MKKKYVKAICIVTILCLTFGIYSLAHPSETSLIGEWGSILKTISESSSQDVYAQGTSGTVLKSDVEQAKQFYILYGMDEQAAEEEAIAYTLKREALYQEAIRNGYEVTADEIWSYLEKLKDDIETADNKDDVMKLIEQFKEELKENENYQIVVK